MSHETRVGGEGREVPQSETLAPLLPRLGPESILVICTRRTDYRLRVTTCDATSTPGDFMIKGVIVKDNVHTPRDTQIFFFCSAQEKDERIMMNLPKEHTQFSTSSTTGFRVEDPTGEDIAGYSGERWKNRFEKEPPRQQRAMASLLSILPDEFQRLSNEAGSLMATGTMSGGSMENYAAQEAAHRAEGEELRRRLAWLQGAYQLFQRMLPADGTMVHWSEAAKQMGWEPRHVEEAMHLVGEIVKPGMNRRIGDLKNHFGAMNDPKKLESEAQRLLGLRDAKGLLKSMQTIRLVERGSA